MAMTGSIQTASKIRFGGALCFRAGCLDQLAEAFEIEVRDRQSRWQRGSGLPAV
jgi:hypothetical protein